VRLEQVLKNVESRYNRAQTLQVHFVENYDQPGQVQKSESGTLSLRKPGRMRWDYTIPPGKLFISDGKNLYLYSPSTNRVEKMKLKESEDMRAPLAFLLGKLHFEKDFEKFESRPEGTDTWISAVPKSDNLPYTKVEFVVTPSNEIRRVRVTGQDHSVLEFEFTQEKLNPALDSKAFQFQMPRGAEVVEGSQ